MPERLVTSRYVPVGVYIGEIIRPQPGNVNAEARIPCYIGKGSRFAKAYNQPVRRSFIREKQLAFSLTEPYEAPLIHAAFDDQLEPVRLYTQTGEKVREDQWAFRKVGNNYAKVQILAEAFDPSFTYYLDYQSISRDVIDSLPVADIRKVDAVGVSEDSPQFAEFKDFLIVTEVTDIIGDEGNTNTDAAVEVPAVDGGNTGTGTVIQNTASEFNHNYNRYYELECTAVGGTTPNRTATFKWKSSPMSGGNLALPPTPLNAADAEPTFTVDEAAPATLVQEIELGIKLEFAFGATNFVAADKYTFNGYGPAFIEKDARYSNTNQFVEYGTVTPAAGNTGTGTLDHGADSDFSGDYNTGYQLKCIAVGGTTPNRTADFVWSEFGELGANGTFQILEATPASLIQSLSKGIKVGFEFGATNFVANDEFGFLVRAPRIYYRNKDDRNYRLGLLTATYPVVDEGKVTGSYSTDTIEGGWGNWEAEGSRDGSKDGHVELLDNIHFFVRNLIGGTDSIGNRHAAQDEHTFSALNSDLIDWTLDLEVTETVEPDEIVFDVNGNITGTPNTYYIILGQIPSNTPKITKSNGDAVSFVQITGTAFAYFAVNPNATLTVIYTHRGEEPDPGQIYYVTGRYLRPDEFYNTVQYAYTRTDGQRLLAPSGIDNDLYVMNELAWDEKPFGVAFIQVKDTDGNGIYENIDYEAAIEAARGKSNLSDKIVLNRMGGWKKQLGENIIANDPFEMRESLDWFGASVGMEIGDVQTQDTLVFLAKKTLQVYGQSFSHGTRILQGSTWGKKTIRLEDNTSAQVTVDGSFIAGSLAAKKAAHADQATTILNETLTSFDEIQVYTDPENIRLGQANIIWFEAEGNGVYRIKEDLTVDTTGASFSLISAMTQKQEVTKIVRREMGLSSIGPVVPSPQAGKALVAANLATILLALYGRGKVADWQDENGNIRKFDPTADIRVDQDPNDKTLYHFYYAYFLKYPIKRLFGLYLVDRNDFGF